MTHVTCRLTAKYRDQLRNPIRSVTEYGLPFTLTISAFYLLLLLRREQYKICANYCGVYVR